MRWLIRLCILTILLLHSIEANSDEVPLTKIGAKTGPILRFSYCYSCGYRKAFEQYVNILKEKYPELQVEGENFDPPGYNMYIAKVLGTLKIVVLILIVSGVNIGLPLNLTPIWQWCINNRFYSCVLIFFTCNAIEAQLISSGAFEIHFNDVPVWSKLETGRIPQPLELFQIIDFHLDMQFSEMDVGKIKFQ
ncbi:selT-like protein [Pseudomyrmex gracilis]|uniref:selT-like protein n=1 Tax=Pseudomyrmex gracilis TaxID=219809 RepID=UPI000995CD92|nr:selT-like protein [Pseudomyrmex gracilis]